MKIFVKNYDGTLAKELSREQFAVVHQYIIGQMNAGAKIRDETIRAILAKAGKPLDFSLENGTVIVPQKRRR